MHWSSNDTLVRRGIASVQPNFNRTVTKSTDENQETGKKDATKIISLMQSPKKEPSQKLSPKASALSDSGLPPAPTDSTLSRAHLEAQLEFPLENFI